MDSQKHTGPGVRAEALTIPELEQSKAAVLNTLASVHSRRSYTFAINSFIAWYVIGDSVLYHSLLKGQLCTDDHRLSRERSWPRSDERPSSCPDRRKSECLVKCPGITEYIPFRVVSLPYQRL
jgi:hypothetical protein